MPSGHPVGTMVSTTRPAASGATSKAFVNSVTLMLLKAARPFTRQ